MAESVPDAKKGQMSDEQQQECVALFLGPDGGGSLDSRSAHKAKWNYASLGRRFGIFRSHARLICLGQIKKSIYLTAAQMDEMRSLYFDKEGQGSRSARCSGNVRWTYRALARRYQVTVSAIDACLNRGRFSPRRHLSSDERRRKVWQPGYDDTQALMDALDCAAKKAGWHKLPPAPPKPKRRAASAQLPASLSQPAQAPALASASCT